MVGTADHCLLFNFFYIHTGEEIPKEPLPFCKYVSTSFEVSVKYQCFASRYRSENIDKLDTDSIFGRDAYNMPLPGNYQYPFWDQYIRKSILTVANAKPECLPAIVKMLGASEPKVCFAWLGPIEIA